MGIEQMHTNRILDQLHSLLFFSHKILFTQIISQIQPLSLRTLTAVVAGKTTSKVSPLRCNAMFTRRQSSVENLTLYRVKAGPPRVKWGQSRREKSPSTTTMPYNTIQCFTIPPSNITYNTTYNNTKQYYPQYHRAIPPSNTIQYTTQYMRNPPRHPQCHPALGF